MYLQLKQTKQLVLESTGIVVESGINNAFPVLLVTSQSNNKTDLGYTVNFSIDIYYNSDITKQPIKQDNYYVDEVTFELFDIVTLPEGTTQVIQSEMIQLQLYNYLLGLPLVLPNGDISEEKLYQDWELINDN